MAVTVAQVAMHTPCTAEHAAPADVSHAHQPTGPVVPATSPEADMQVTYPALHAE